MKVGDKVTWRTVNRQATGTLVRRIEGMENYWIVQLDNGRQVPVHENTMTIKQNNNA